MTFDPVALQEWAMGLLWYTVGLLSIAILDAFLGSVEAWYRGKFSWEYLPRFLKTFAAYAAAWLVLEVVAVLPVFLRIEFTGFMDAMTNYGPKALIGFFAVTKYLASILKHVDAIKDIAVPEPEAG